jgi:hypothetical protein
MTALLNKQQIKNCLLVHTHTHHMQHTTHLTDTTEHITQAHTTHRTDRQTDRQTDTHTQGKKKHIINVTDKHKIRHIFS